MSARDILSDHPAPEWFASDEPEAPALGKRQCRECGRDVVVLTDGWCERCVSAPLPSRTRYRVVVPETYSRLVDAPLSRREYVVTTRETAEKIASYCEGVVEEIAPPPPPGTTPESVPASDVPATEPTESSREGVASRLATFAGLVGLLLVGLSFGCGRVLPTAAELPAVEHVDDGHVSAAGKIQCDLFLSVETKVDRTARGVWLKAMLAETVPGGCGDLEVDGYPDWTLTPQGSTGDPVWHAYHTFADAQANNVAADLRGKYMHLTGPQGQYLVRSRASVGGGRDHMLCTLDEAGAECHRVDGAGNPL